MLKLALMDAKILSLVKISNRLSEHDTAFYFILK